MKKYIRKQSTLNRVFGQNIKLITLYIILFIFYGPTLTKAQPPSLPANANFYDYMSSFYNSSRYNPLDESEGGDKAQHERLGLIWGPRLYPHGDFSVANRAIIDYAQSFVPVNVRTEQPNWICIGPSDNPTNSSRNGVGQIHRITFDPNYNGTTNQTIYACSGYGGLWRTENDGGLWTLVNTDGLPITSVGDVAIDPTNPNNIFISTGVPDGGVTLQYSPNWTKVNPINTIGIYRSTDYGLTWNTINSGFINEFYINGGTVRKLTIDQANPNVLFAATSLGIFRTENAMAATPIWEKVFAGVTGTDGDFRSVEFKPGSSNVLYASSTNIFRSLDGGDTWLPMTGSTWGLDFPSMEPFYPYRINLAVTPANGEKLFAYILGDDETIPDNDNGELSIYIYIFNGTSWSQFNFAHRVDNSKDWMALTVSPIDDELFFYYGSHGNAGTGVYGNYPGYGSMKYFDYVDIGIYADGHVLAFQPNVTANPKLFYGHHGGVSCLDLQTLTGEFRNTGLQNMLHWSFDDSEFENDVVITANQDCFSYFLENDNWKFISGDGDSYSSKLSKVNNDLFFASNSDKKLQSYNKSTGTTVGTEITPLDDFNYPAEALITKTFRVESLPNSNFDFFSFSEIYQRNFDSPTGQTASSLWDTDSDIGKIEPALHKRQITEIDYCQSNPNYIYVATGGVYSEDPSAFAPILAKTTIGGNNDDYWFVHAYDQITYPGISSTEFPVISGIAVHPTNHDKVWISMIGYDNIDMRVAYTADGGLTWTNADPTNSLPELPVNGIVYQYGSNDALYLATDVGVYYKDATMTDWEEYGVFPHVRVTEIKINYCQNKLRAATFGRTVWEGDLLPSTNPVCYTVENGETLVWDKQKTLRTGVRIESGGELIITGEVTMPKGGQIIVEVGGKLTIDGGKITNGCGELWQGIQVWGTSTGAQNPLEQGWVSITDGTIENAIRGIVANKYESSGSPVPGYTGGVIQARGTTFKNCITAVQFDSYEPFSASWFNDCQFVVDADFAAIGTGLYPKWEMVKIAGHRGTQFINSDFVNGAPEEFDTEERGTGILSINGGFSVTDGSSFTDLYYGIYGMDVLAQNTFYVHDANFSSYRGVYMGSCYNNQIDGSTFIIPESITGENMQSYGLYMEYSTGYAIEDNTFTSNESTPTGIGIYVNNSGTDDNEIYRNEFTNLQYSIVAQDINRKNTIGGLVIKCNYFDNTTSDVVVVAGKGSETIDHGIAKNQGALSTDPTQMAGNLFYYNTTSIDFDDLNNGLNHFNYFYPNNTVSGSGNVDPQDYTTNTVTKYGIPFLDPWSYTNGCPAHESGGGTLLAKMVVADEKADSTSSLLAVLVDNGDTPELASEVNQSTPAQTVDLYNELMATSPYLSDSVVESAIVKEDVLPNALLRDIMVANAHSSKSEVLMNTLDSRWDPMPDYMKAQILQGRSLVSLKEETESRLGAFRLDKARALYGLSRMYMYDTLNPSTAVDSLMDLLSTEYTLSAQYQLAMLELGKGEYAQGSSVLSNIPTHITLTSQELTKHQQMVDYYNWLTSVKQSQGNILNPSASQRQQLWNMAMADSSKAGVYARNLLVALGDTTYHEPIILPDLYKSAQDQDSYEELLNVKGPCLLRVFPNPATGYVILEYKLETDMPATISIHDMKGVKINSMNTSGQQNQLTVITRDWLPGVYLAGLHINGKLIESTKFTVVK